MAGGAAAALLQIGHQAMRICPGGGSRGCGGKLQTPLCAALRLEGGAGMRRRAGNTCSGARPSGVGAPALHMPLRSC